MVLHGDEPCPPSLDGDLLAFGELPRIHAAGAQIAHLAALDDVVQRLHRLLDGGVGVETVDLPQVEVVGAQALQRCIDGMHQPLATSCMPGRPGGTPCWR